MKTVSMVMKVANPWEQVSCVEAHKSSQLTEEHPLQRGRYDGNIIQRKHTRKPGETMAREESFTLGLLQSASSDAADRRTSSI